MHGVKRLPNMMQILECAFDYIDIDSVKIIDNRGNENNTYFTDMKHTYHFSISKNTLYMVFDNLQLLDSFEVEILEDPYMLLLSLTRQVDKREKYPDYVFSDNIIQRQNKILYESKPVKPMLCLPLYSRKGNTGDKFVPEKSGLNQWNAGGRARNTNELYIPYQAVDRQRNMTFFPPRDTSLRMLEE